MKPVIGITGGVGAGKSTVLRYMKEKYGAEIIECDEIGRKLEEPGGACFAPVVKLFRDAGADVVTPGGELDRAGIAKLIFSDEKLRRALDDIVHPAVMAEVKQRMAEAEKKPEVPFTVIESAILIEAGYAPLCTQVWYVDTDPQVRRRRLKESRGYSDEKIDRIFASQKDSAFFREHAQFVIDNSSDHVNNTFEQIDRGILSLR